MHKDVEAAGGHEPEARVDGCAFLGRLQSDVFGAVASCQVDEHYHRCGGDASAPVGLRDADLRTRST